MQSTRVQTTEVRGRAQPLGVTTKKLRLRTCETRGRGEPVRRNLQRRSVQRIPASGIRQRERAKRSDVLPMPDAIGRKIKPRLQPRPSCSFSHKLSAPSPSAGLRLPTIFVSLPPLRLPVLGTGALAELMSHRKRRCCSKPSTSLVALIV